MAALRSMGVDLCDGTAELNGLADEDLDELCDDLFAKDKLEADDNESSDDGDSVDEDGEAPPMDENGNVVADERAGGAATNAAADRAQRRATTAQRQKRLMDERIERIRVEEELERSIGYTQPVRRRVIEIRLAREHDWWLSSVWSRVMFSEEDHADAIVMGRIDRTGAKLPPPTGLGRVFELPKRMSQIVFEPWVAFTTTEVNDTNTVATFYVDLLLELMAIALRALVVSFNLRRFAACMVTMEDGTILLFCGSAVCTGPKGPAQSNAQCQRYVLWLNQLGIPATMQGYRLQNLVSKASAGWEVDLNAIHAKYPFHAQYKPKRFPGVIFRLDFEEDVVCADDNSAVARKEDQLVLIIFQSSKTIITGSKARAKTRLVWTWVQANILREFKKVSSEVHVSEADYRRTVAEEESIIEHTCAQVVSLSAERQRYDMLVDCDDDNEHLRPASHTTATAARAARKRSYFDAVGDELLGNEGQQQSSIGRYIDERTGGAAPTSSEQFVADWLAKNTALIKSAPAQ